MSVSAYLNRLDDWINPIVVKELRQAVKSRLVVVILMVFLLQHNQNRDSVALHLKLDELVAVTRAANDQLIGIEDASEDKLRELARNYLELAKRAAASEGTPGTGDDRGTADDQPGTRRES